MRTRVRKVVDLWDFMQVMRKEAKMHREYNLRMKALDTHAVTAPHLSAELRRHGT